MKLEIGLYILTGICIIGLIVTNILKADMTILSPITWALIGAVIGKNTNNISMMAQKAIGVFKK